MLNQKRDMEAVKAFFRDALELAEEPSEYVVTDGLTSYPRAISEELPVTAPMFEVAVTEADSA